MTGGAMNHAGDEMTAVALIGLGNIGSRHLQGLARCRSALGIRLVDPSPEAIVRAKQRWAEVDGERTDHVFLEDDSAHYDVAIVATAADHRRTVIEELAARATVGTWIVEKPIAQRIADVDRLDALVGSSAWINTPRRLIPWHRSIAGEIDAVGKTIAVTVEGGRWGLACNALHFIDLVRWWSGNEPVRIDTDGLDHHWHDSKRAGYSEVFGTLRVLYASGTELTLVSTPDGGPHVITARTDDGDWTIEEGKGLLHRPGGSVSEGRMTPQSELTGPLVEGIVAGEAPALPELRDMARVERLLLSALIPHRMAYGGPADRLDVT